MLTRFLITPALATLLAGSAFGQVVVQPPPMVVQPAPFVVQPPPVVVDPQPLPPPPPPPVCAAVTWGPPLNLRTWPNGPLIASYWSGTRVVIDGSNGGPWVHAIVGPVSGWMFSPYLTPVPCWF
jgi:hypothetical protein